MDVERENLVNEIASVLALEAQRETGLNYWVLASVALKRIEDEYILLGRSGPVDDRK